MAFQENMNDNPPTLSIVDLEDEDIMVEYNELMEVDLEEANSEQNDDESEDEDEDEDDNEDQYQYFDEDEDDNKDI